MADIRADEGASEDIIASALKRARDAVSEEKAAPRAAAAERMKALRQRVAAKEVKALAERGVVPMRPEARDEAGEAQDDGVRENPPDLAMVLAERRLGADWMSRVHESHRLAISGGITLFCRRCGCLSGGETEATARVKSMARSCKVVIGSQATTKSALVKLHKGRHPQSGHLLCDGAVHTVPPDWAGQG